MVLWMHFIKAQIGEKIWDKIRKQNGAELYIIMPEKDDEYNYYALLYLDKYISGKEAETATIIYSDHMIKRVVSVFTKNSRVHSIYLSRFKMECLIKYYALYEFSSKVTIISLKKPYDTYGENLLGFKGVTKETLLCFDIYRFYEIPNVKKPYYKGDNQRIRDFVNR